jgi:ABC-type nitrate/sulfonate/bicarbonate transport system ATPase subunit
VRTLGASQPKIELERVCVDFPSGHGTIPVLRDIDLFAGEGEFVTLIGPSGCGKSTLLNVVAGLQEPTSGSIRLDGRSTAVQVGATAYMPQKDLLMPWRTVLDNTILGMEIRGVPRAEARVQALSLFELFGLSGFEHDYPAVLSGGMRQRAAFLRTVLTGKDVMLLDEPFGALDALTRSNMQEWLLHLWDSLRKTILFVTHDVDEAVLLSDRVYLLTARPGRVKLTLEVDLPRPREYQMVTSSRFVALKEVLLVALREEAQKAMVQDAEDVAEGGVESAEASAGTATISGGRHERRIH